MSRPIGEAWRRWKRRRQYKRLKAGLPEHPADWAAEWEEHGGVVKPYVKPSPKASGMPSDMPSDMPSGEGETQAERMRLLEVEIRRLKALALSTAVVRDEILKISHAKPEIPKWLTSSKPRGEKTLGVPTLFASDWHWGEVVDPLQIGGSNAFDMTIAHRRAKAMINNAVDLLKNHMVNPRYDGIVFAIGGDQMSGDIHEELSQTNAQPVMPCLLDLLGVMVWCIETLADEFGNVFVPCVTGNHTRTSQKPRAKGRNHTSFDWLLYQLLDRHFANDERVTFLIPDGPDALYKIYNHRYLLAHGDAFRGGDGQVGALGPIIRGDLRKRRRNGAIGQGYDTLMLGHWHQLIQMQTLIVNGSLKGYDEYAYAGNFGFEEPKQALWITHPTRGITFQMPVQMDDRPASASGGWVSVYKPEAA